jgi:hypothetical protein
VVPEYVLPCTQEPAIGPCRVPGASGEHPSCCSLSFILIFESLNLIQINSMLVLSFMLIFDFLNLIQINSMLQNMNRLLRFILFLYCGPVMNHRIPYSEENCLTG